MKRAILPLFLSIVLILSCSSSKRKSSTLKNASTALKAGSSETNNFNSMSGYLTTKDGVKIFYTLSIPENVKDKTPAVILLHQNMRNHKDFDPIVPDLISMGYTIIAIDFRSFGQSGGSRDYLAMLNDVEAAYNYLKTLKNVDMNRLAIVGCSIGANMAIMAGTKYNAKVVEALSPGLDYFGLKPGDYIANYKGALLIMVNKGDRYSYYSSKQLINMATSASDKLFKAYNKPGRVHGKDLFQTIPEAKNIMLDWLKKHL